MSGKIHVMKLTRLFLPVVVFLVTLSILSFPSIASAQLESVEERNQANQAASQDGTPSLQNFSGNLVESVQVEVLCATLPESWQCSTKPNGQAYNNNGVFGGLTVAINMMYDSPPATTERYIADLLHSANIATPAYAQGLGFAALDPILNTWKTFRNISYLFFVLVMIAIGFMIMFRQKMGQAAVTAQQAIPQIIIALLMVTFSYAIAGLLIDIMYLIMFFIVGIFGKEADLIDKNFIQLGWYMITNGFSAVDALGDFVDGNLGGLGDVVAGAVEIFSEVTFAIIITIVLLIGMFKLFFELLKSYISIIISIAFAPIILMFGAIPGKNTFSSWVKSIIGNLASFPTVLIILVIFDQLTNNRGTTETGFLPPYLFGSGTAGAIPALVGIGLILAMPEAVKKVKSMLGASDGPFGEIVQAGWKKAWDKRGTAMPLAAGVLGGGAGLAAGAALGGVSALRGGGTMNERLRRVGRSAGLGALVGTGVPLVTPAAYKTAKSVGKEIMKQGVQATGLSIFEDLQFKKDEYLDRRSARHRDASIPAESPTIIDPPIGTYGGTKQPITGQQSVIGNNFNSGAFSREDTQHS